jgi:hypothetical protein
VRDSNLESKPENQASDGGVQFDNSMARQYERSLKKDRGGGTVSFIQRITKFKTHTSFEVSRNGEVAVAYS